MNMGFEICHKGNREVKESENTDVKLKGKYLEFHRMMTLFVYI
jgi:hypothetical protein